ncbi:MAG: threonine--tRNA ligase [Termitinemataceae bacterium]|nr:MAG: threonine--tRNA ligase [Termitinemataceae bacterium]
MEDNLAIMRSREILIFSLKNGILKYMNEKLQTIRHSVSHVMAEAVAHLFPGVKIAIGPSIDTGFYYDFLLPRPIIESDLALIEAEMKKIIESREDFVRTELSREEAKKRFADQMFKIELIDDLSDDEPISIYEQKLSDGTVTNCDLCRGPHVANTREINCAAFRLMSIAGAYWRGDEHREMLTRIYGTAWETPKDLKAYLNMLAEAEKRDHRKLARELDLFHVDVENPGQIFWHPNGWTIYRTLENYVRDKIRSDGYVEVKTPFIMARSLWERSGHWAKYKDNMFITESEKRMFAIKPMNCPGHIEIFKQQIRSYRDLPLRLAEFGSCTRNEPSGSLHGCMRIRGFVQDDAHIFCTDDQVPDEARRFARLLYSIYADFGFKKEGVLVKLSTRPQLRIGSDATWDSAEAALADTCRAEGIKFEIAEGEGAFYGPKLEFTLIDALGRQWQCGTLQLDYQMPSKERLDAEYIGADGERHTPVMLHRAILGSLERFIGILLENFSGALPAWLHYEQAAVIPVAAAFNDYALKVCSALTEAGLRCHANNDNERLNAKIRLAQSQKIPYMLVVGEKEMEADAVSIRLRDGKQLPSMKIDEFCNYVKQKIDTHAMDL